MTWMCVSINKNPPEQPGASLHNQPSERTLSVSFINPLYNHKMNAIYLYILKLIAKTFTFSRVVLVGFNLELHSTLNINEKLLLCSKNFLKKEKKQQMLFFCNEFFTKPLKLLRSWQVTHHSLHSR